MDEEGEEEEEDLGELYPSLQKQMDFPPAALRCQKIPGNRRKICLFSLASYTLISGKAFCDYVLEIK